MEVNGVWLPGIASSDGVRIADQLVARDIRVLAASSVERSMLVLVFFAELNAALIDVLDAANHRGQDRVLAVHVGPLCLPNSSVWKILDRGASDVVALNAGPWQAAVLDAGPNRSAPDPSSASDRSSQAFDQIAARLRRWREVDALVDSDLVRTNLVGQSRAWRGLLRQVVEVACFTDAHLLITGESGTGKELVSRLVHTLDRRGDKGDLVVLDCTTLVPELVGSELFGHERGSFTGASAQRDGAFALSDRGTLFLDEVGELPLALQPQLLRVLQERTFKRIGANRWAASNFRLVCATNRCLDTEVREGRFRADLFFRIAQCRFCLPTLRERSEDIVPLAEHFLVRSCRGGPTPTIGAAVREFLQNRSYAGNVRELAQLVARMHARHVGPGPLSVGDIPEDERPHGEVVDSWCNEEFERVIRRALSLGTPLKDMTQSTTETAIRLAVEQEGGNLQRAARRLGVTDRALQLRRAHQQRMSS